MAILLLALFPIVILVDLNLQNAFVPSLDGNCPSVGRFDWNISSFP